MTKHSFLALLVVLLLIAPSLARAEDVKPDDSVILDLTAENWVTTKTALVDLSVEAAVTGQGGEGSLRAAMQSAVTGVAKGDWRLISFNRSQDQTGLERWSAVYESRLPEADLNGIQDRVKKSSKPGMQIKVANIAFTPTLDEVENAMTQLRVDLYKKTNEQVVALNSTIPGRAFRIGLIDFSTQNTARPPMARMAMLANKSMATDEIGGNSMGESMERSQKITLKAHVILAALPPGASK